MRQIFIPLFIIVFTTAIIGQNDKRPQGLTANGRLFGKVIDASSRLPLAFASVTVNTKLGDGKEKLIDGGLTEENGDFNITSLPMGIHIFKVSYIGYEELAMEVKIAAPNMIEQDLGDLLIKEVGQQMATIEIKADKSTMNMSLEKKVFNVDKNITSIGGTAEDVMKNIPSVTVDTDGNTKLRDRSATIYVDGKPTLLTLNQISSEQIETIEVISNPSSKYEAAAMGGILNIVLKQNRKGGYSGIISAGGGTQSRYNTSLSLNLNKGKWNFGGFYSLNNNHSPTRQYVYLTALDGSRQAQSYFNQNSDFTYMQFNQTGRINADYAIDVRNTLNFAVSVYGGSFDIPVEQTFEYLTEKRIVDGSGSRNTLTENCFTRNSTEVQWKKTYAKKNKTLSAFFNYGWGGKSGYGEWNTLNFDAGGILFPNNPQLVRTTDLNNNDQVTFQLDYANPLSETSKIEMGVRSFWSERDQVYFFDNYNYSTTSYLNDAALSLDAKIVETINAAYVMYTGKTSYGINFQAGLRFEQSGLSGISRMDGQGDFGYDYPKGNTKDVLRSLFPSLYFSKNINEATEIGINFSRKLQRPNFRALMPGVRANDNQNIEIGNPALQPEFINLAELNFRKIFGQHNLLSTLYFNNETNTIKPFTTTSPTDQDVLITQFVNGENQIMIGLDNALKMVLGKNLDIMLSSNVFRFDVTVNNIKNTGWANNSKINLNYKLPKGFSLQLNGGFEGNRPMPQGNRKGIGYTDFAVRKVLSKNGASAIFTINDVFDSRKDITTVSLPTYTQQSQRRRESRFFRVTFQMPFGKTDTSVKKPAKRGEGQEMQDF